MSDVSGATDESLPPQFEEISVGGTEPLSPRQAAQALSQHRWKRDAQETKAEAPESAAEPKEIPAQQDAAPETDTGEQPTATDEQPETAPLELPRSWSKDKTELWAKLDPDAQGYLLEQDSKSTKAVRQAQNEAAEQRKALEADRTAMEQARKHYDEALPVLLQTLHRTQLGEFSDIRSMDDVEKLAREDWPRYALWDAQQKKIAAVQQEMQQGQQRAQQDFRSKWDSFAKDEDAKFIEAAPEMSDATRATKVREGSVAMLKDVGFSDTDLAKVWNGEASLSFRDHRLQLLIRDAYRYREAQTVAKTKAVKPVPTVQRPGSPAQRTPDADIKIKQLDQQFETRPDWKNAAALLIAQRARR